MGLNIIVCIKSVVVEVPDGPVSRSAESCELNPFDRSALEMGLQLREANGGTVSAVTMGPDSSTLALLEAMALGVDRGVLISDPALAGSDTLATSTALAAAIKRFDTFDLVLFGTRTADSDTGQVGPQTAVLLDLPLVTGADSVEIASTDFKVVRKADGFRETFELPFPAVLTVHPGAVQPRDVGLYGISSAFEAYSVEKWDLNDVRLTADQVGEAGSPTRVFSLKRVKKDRTCEFLSGSTEEQADALVQRLVRTGLVG
jgi:electron transfer flavoprotein beta subunit